MNKDIIDVDYIAALARLELDSELHDKFQQDMDAILGYVDMLSELDLSDIEPTAHAASLNNVWREDRKSEPLGQEIMLKNAPDILDDELIKVPRVLAEEGGA